MFKKLRRKALGLLFGSALGLGLTIIPKKSHAWGIDECFLNDEEIFKCFIEQGGAVMMRFLGYRFMANWELAWDDYTVNRILQDKINAARRSEEIAIKDQAIQDAFENSAEHKLKLETYISEDDCANDILASDVYSPLKEKNKDFSNNSSHILSRYMIGTHVDNNIESINQRNKIAKKLLNSNKHLQLTQLQNLSSDTPISSLNTARYEVATLMADIKSLTSNKKNQNLKSDSVLAQAINEQVSIISSAFSYLITKRLANIDASNVDTSSLPDDLQSKYEQYGKFSELLLLKLQVDSTSVNSNFTDNLEDNPSFTSVLIEFEKQQALNNALKVELYKIDELRQTVQAIASIYS